MLLCRSMGPVSFGGEFTEREIAAKILNMKLNETLHLGLQRNFASNFYIANKEIDKNMTNC